MRCHLQDILLAYSNLRARPLLTVVWLHCHSHLLASYSLAHAASLPLLVFALPLDHGQSTCVLPLLAFWSLLFFLFVEALHDISSVFEYVTDNLVDEQYILFQLPAGYYTVFPYYATILTTRICSHRDPYTPSASDSIIGCFSNLHNPLSR